MRNSRMSHQKDSIGKPKWLRGVISAALGVLMAGLLGCLGHGVDGKYHDADGMMKVELAGGKATLDLGRDHIDGTYTVDADKVTIRPTAQPNVDLMVLMVNKDGTLSAPTNGNFVKLVKD
jgi:hypothetical protein